VDPSDFFKSQSDELWGGTHDVFDAELIIAVTNGPIHHADDLDVAQGLAELVHEELRVFGASDSNPKLKDSEITQALKALRAVLQRLGVPFDPPFRISLAFKITGAAREWLRWGVGQSGADISANSLIPY
jgi:hypothetical protein